MPTVHEPMSFKAAMVEAARNDVNVILHTEPTTHGTDPTKTPPNLPLVRGGEKRVGIFVGPEGGWTDAEIKNALTAGFHLGTLGKLILRGETAAIIATYLAATNKL